MSFPKVNPTKTKAWEQLKAHFSETQSGKMQEYFTQDPSRATRFSIAWEDFYLDYSKNRITDTTQKLLLQLAEEVQLKEAITAQFSGAPINETENRAVGHTALRDFAKMRPEVKDTLQKVKAFSDSVIQGEWTGYSGKAIQTVVNIGIGGSDLGPTMVCEALQYYKNHLQVRFVSNVDGDHIAETLRDLDAETTLFIVVSKTFTTQETLTNANSAKEWFLRESSSHAIAKHFVAVSANLEAVSHFGISSNNIFPMWDWVGGRFSLWSAVGLSIACAVGYDQYENLLVGAHEMDLHFKNTEFGKNIPVTLGLLSVWYNNFYGAESECIVPYSQYLNKLVPYLQQGFMESNGKSVDRNGESIDYQTGTIVWGSVGTNAQHAFFQLIHQGTKLVPTDFIGFTKSLHGNKDHHNKLMANMVAQTEALLQGTYETHPENNFKAFVGNKPTNTLLIESLTPKSLGSLIAMYEHKLFVQGVVWNIFSYDQWGVELGKQLAKGTLAALEGNNASNLQNPSTQRLIDKLN